MTTSNSSAAKSDFLSIDKYYTQISK